MGWSFNPSYNRKQLIEDISRDWERTDDEGKHIKAKCLAKCYRGGRFLGILWSVWENTITDGEQVETRRYIYCDILQYRKGDGWGNKAMSESVHPFYYSCPLGYLKMAPVACQAWRDKVQEYHATSKKAVKTV